MDLDLLRPLLMFVEKSGGCTEFGKAINVDQCDQKGGAGWLEGLKRRGLRNVIGWEAGYGYPLRPRLGIRYM